MKTFNGIALVTLGTLALSLTACGGNDKTSGGGGGGSGSGPRPMTESFATCIANLKPSCAVTDSKIDSACASLTMIPIPLTDGGSYGPATLDAGPYGGKLDWNQGANTPYVNTVNGSESICIPIGVDSFKEPASVSAQVINTRGLDHSLYTIFRPACMKDGETYPVITWANGTCGETQGYAPLLSTVASHGYVIIASNSTWTGTAPTDKVQLRALDYAKYLNDDTNSILYHRLDLDKIGAMGHSQGAQATANASSDPRIKAVMFFSGGTSNHQPFVYISADRDIGTPTTTTLSSATNGATQPGSWIFYHDVLETGGSSTGHLVLMEQPERVLDMTIAWWDFQLKGDAAAKSMFVGDGCTLCSQTTEYEYGHNALLK
jgi:pimeloyl-ACP methyl ester carboxylesterase